MKIISFETKDYELADFAHAGEYGLDVTLCDKELTADNVDMVQGFEGVTTLGFSDLRAPMLGELARRGVKYLATRTVGFNHIDLDAARQCGIRVSNASYEPYNVADFTVMLMLVIASACRNMWISLGIGVILVFTLSVFPQDNEVLSLFPFASPYQTFAAAAENGRALLFVAACGIETVLFGIAEVIYLKVRRWSA